MIGRDKCYHHGGRTPIKTTGLQSKYRDIRYADDVVAIQTISTKMLEIERNEKLFSSREVLKAMLAAVSHATKEVDTYLLLNEKNELLNHKRFDTYINLLSQTATKLIQHEELMLKQGYFFTIVDITRWLTDMLDKLQRSLDKSNYIRAAAIFKQVESLVANKSDITRDIK
jgi:hypothetical protein